MSQEPLSFTTPETSHISEIVVKKSRFIGHVFTVRTEAEAANALNEIRVRHKSANHNCFAYTIGLTVPIERFSDDGEPSGTAGRPILEVLRRKNISNALVVVTRYFGGTLLGANGLVHAYQDATIAVLEEASILKCSLVHQVHFICSYALYGKLEYELTQLGYSIQDKVFEADVRFMVVVPTEAQKNFVEHMYDLTNGQIELEVRPAEYMGVRDNGEYVPYDLPSKVE